MAFGWDRPLDLTRSTADPVNGAPGLRVCIDARLEPGSPGGLETVVIGLARGLSRLTDGDEEYFFLVNPVHVEWLSQYLGANSRVLRYPYSLAERILRLARRSPGIRERLVRLGKRLVPSQAGRFRIAQSRGVIEAAGVDVVHFTTQGAFRTGIPSIYHPHDLQHRHLPQFFTRREYDAREKAFREYCSQASAVAVVSRWTRNDVIEAYGIEPEKVHVIPFAPGLEEDEPELPEREAVRRRLALPGDFVLYPAQTWPHKNHLALVEALPKLRSTAGSACSLVFTGRVTTHAEVIRARSRELGVESRIHMLGFVSQSDLKALYRLSRAAVIPSLFEAGSFPIWEAFRAGIPVATARTTSLPDQLGDAGLVFDPRDSDDIARSVDRLLTDDQLRERFIRAGRERVQHLTWDRTARCFRALYRSVAGRRLSAEDRQLLVSAATF